MPLAPWLCFALARITIQEYGYRSRVGPDVVAAVRKANGGKGVDYVVECSARSQQSMSDQSIA